MYNHGEKSMKCIKSKSGKTIERVKDEVASAKVKTGMWNYCPKSEWKKATRKNITENVGKDESTDDDESKTHGLKAKERKKLNKKK